MITPNLRTGHIVEFENGEQAMVLLNTPNGNILAGDTWLPFLIGDIFKEGGCSEGSVNKVYQLNSNLDYAQWIKGRSENKDLIWERPRVKVIVGYAHFSVSPQGAIELKNLAKKCEG